MPRNTAAGSNAAAAAAGAPSSNPQDVWAAVDRYTNEQLVRPDAMLDAALAASAAAGLPDIQVTPSQGKFLMMLAQFGSARRILEIGTLGGYSTIWLARALPPGGRIVTLELSAKHAEVARTNLARAGVDRLVDIRVGPALETLPKLAAEGGAPFDLVFIDADKPSNADYFAWALRLTRVGGVILIDNVVRDGEVVDAASRDPSVQGVRRMNALIAAEPRVSATTIQTVGSKGYDGFTMAIVSGA